MPSRTAAKSDATTEDEAFTLNLTGGESLTLEVVDSLPATTNRGRGVDAETIKLADYILESERAGKACAIPNVTSDNRTKVEGKINSAVKYINKTRDKDNQFKVRKSMDPASGRLFFGEETLINSLMNKS